MQVTVFGGQGVEVEEACGAAVERGGGQVHAACNIWPNHRLKCSPWVKRVELDRIRLGFGYGFTSICGDGGRGGERDREGEVGRERNRERERERFKTETKISNPIK